MAQYNITDLQETIVALATPSGIGAIGVIRLSGKDAITICNSVFKGPNLLEQAPNTIHFGKIVEGDTVLDEVLVSLFKAPKSYTGEDVIEVSCHGSPYIQEKVINAFVKQGARLAKPGEFTLRAFMNKKLDLSQAEAVADLISSDSSTSHNAAMKQMRGGFSNKIAELRQQLIDFAALIELELDFGEEDVEFADRGKLERLVLEIQQVIQGLIQSFEYGNVIKKGIPTVIAGKPNAGKSTLLNALVNEDRAIVSEIAGTTRDTIEEAIQIDGITFRFIDTAGLREKGSKIESIGIDKAYEKIKQASVVIYLFDVDKTKADVVEATISALEHDNAVVLKVANKTDKTGLEKAKNKFKAIDDIIFISSKEKEIEPLLEELKKLVRDKKQLNDDVIVTNARHFDALNKSNEALTKVLDGLQTHISGDLVALDIRQALYHLGEITGEITSEDLLSSIFSRFCIGK